MPVTRRGASPGVDVAESSVEAASDRVVDRHRHADAVGAAGARGLRPPRSARWRPRAPGRGRAPRRPGARAGPSASGGRGRPALRRPTRRGRTRRPGTAERARGRRPRVDVRGLERADHAATLLARRRSSYVVLRRSATAPAGSGRHPVLGRIRRVPADGPDQPRPSAPQGAERAQTARARPGDRARAGRRPGSPPRSGVVVAAVAAQRRPGLPLHLRWRRLQVLVALVALAVFIDYMYLAASRTRSPDREQTAPGRSENILLVGSTTAVRPEKKPEPRLRAVLRAG